MRDEDFDNFDTGNGDVFGQDHDDAPPRPGKKGGGAGDGYGYLTLGDPESDAPLPPKKKDAGDLYNEGTPELIIDRRCVCVCVCVCVCECVRGVYGVWCVGWCD